MDGWVDEKAAEELVKSSESGVNKTINDTTDDGLDELDVSVQISFSEESKDGLDGWVDKETAEELVEGSESGINKAINDTADDS